VVPKLEKISKNNLFFKGGVMKMYSQFRFWISSFFIVSCILIASGCGIGGSGPEDHPICDALDKNTTQEFLDSNNTANFEQLDNNQSVFLFTSSAVSEAYDGQNVIELKSAVVEYDFEDDLVDRFNLGGFWARWQMVMVPFSEELSQQFQDAVTIQEKEDILKQLLNDPNRIQALLSGPFERNDCEWGDTDEIGTQTLTYSNYGFYDWDFYPASDRILGILYEGDDGIEDDVINLFDISKNEGSIVLEEAGKYRIELISLSNVSVP
jgi:hypothetical protein